MKKLHKRSSSKHWSALERMFELAVLLTQGIDRGLAGHGLTRARAELMWRLRRGGPVTQRELSESLRCTPRNVTGLVDALEGAGLVERRPHPTDRRATLVGLTEEGSAATAAWESGYEEMAEALFGALPADQLDGFLSTLDVILETLRKAYSA